MRLRRPALALGCLALVATLAACDLPGGTPPVISRDREPNDIQEDAVVLGLPDAVSGTVDGDDWSDWYVVDLPDSNLSITVSCHGVNLGDPRITMWLYPNVYDSPSQVKHVACGDGQASATLPHVEPGSGNVVWIQAGAGDDHRSVYAFRVEAGPSLQT